MNCPKCSQSVPDDARFCGKCGQSLDTGAMRSQSEPAAAGTGVGNFGFASAAASGTGPAGATPYQGAPPHVLPRLIERVKNILLTPKAEWPVIEPEPTSVAQLYTGYVMPMAAFAAVMSFIRMCVIGVNIPFGGTLRMPIASGLTTAVITFVSGLIGLFLVGFIINMLAPTFAGERNQRQAIKTAAYAFTPAWLGTALTFLPLGTLLQLIAGIYGIYLLYLGLPLLMRSDGQKVGGYTAAVVVCTFLIGILFGVVSAALGGASRMAAFGGGNAALYDSHSPEAKAAAAERGGAVLGNIIGSALGTDEKGKAGLGSALANMAKAGQQIEQQEANAANRNATAGGSAAGQAPGGAQAASGAGSATGGAGSTGADRTQNAVVAAGGLLSALGGALGGSHRVEPVDFNTLKGMLPTSLPQLQRTSAEGSSQQAVGVKSSSATGEYQGSAGVHVEIKITDISGVAGLMEAASGLAPTGEKESDTGFEKDTVLNGRPVHEKYDRSSGQGEVDAIIAKRFEVDVTGRGVDIGQLEKTLDTIDLARLDAMQDVGATKN